MKKPVLIIVLCLLPALAAGQDIGAYEIVKKANDIFNRETSWNKTRMTINTTSGKKRELIYESWSKNKGEKSLIKYTSPRRVKDQAMLLLNNSDDIWSYDPRTNRVRKLATHAKKQKMQGSDFSYEDMGSGETFLTDFEHKLLREDKKEGVNCYVVEMKVKSGVNSNYSRLISWIGKDDFVFRFIEYFDEKDMERLLKTLTMSDIKEFDGVPTAMKAVMLNKMDNSDTIMEIMDVKYNLEIDDSLFTERGMKK